MTQWHPIFSHLLRSALQQYYDVQTNVPVGDLPREADIILLRRASASKPPFKTLWGHLSRWNILEIQIMARKRNRGDIDWDAVMENFGGLEAFIQHYGSKQLIEEGIAKQVVDKIGLEGLLAILSPEKQHELLSRMQAGGKSS